MLSIRDLYRLQSEYGVADGSFKESEISYSDYVSSLRTYISKNLPAEFTSNETDVEKKKDIYVTMVSQYVEQHPVKVSGYTRPNGTRDIELLIEDLIDSIMGEGIIRDALEDPEVDEIQINDMKTLFVQKGGVTDYYVDSKGRVPQFSYNEEIHILLNKLTDDGTGNIPQFTDGSPLLNAKTVKDQYRINAVHHSANTQDKPPHNFPITNVVIRKFKESNLSIEDLIKTESCTEQMGRLLMKLGRAELKLFCVGPTGSGKTTLLRIIASTVPKDKRMILIQNPTEITFMERDEYGRNTRNVVHWEVVQGADTSRNDTATMANLISNALRSTPEVILIGEAREPEEFEQIQRAMRTGHKTLGTFHALDARDAVERFADEITTTGDTMASIRNVCNSIDVVVSQFKFENGDRKIMEIAEILGVDEKGEPKINTLFEYQFTGEIEPDENGKMKVLGLHKQVGYMSQNMQNSLFKVGIPFSEIAEFCSDDDIQEYKNRQSEIRKSINESR